MQAQLKEGDRAHNLYILKNKSLEEGGRVPCKEVKYAFDIRRERLVIHKMGRALRWKAEEATVHKQALD